MLGVFPTNSEYERSIKEMANEAPLKEKGAVCLYDGAPCFRHVRCFLRVGDFRIPLYVCGRIRLKGSNSVVDRGMGMTVYEKLVRAGCVPDEFCV
jgi:hypothetical protein